MTTLKFGLWESSGSISWNLVIYYWYEYFDTLTSTLSLATNIRVCTLQSCSVSLSLTSVVRYSIFMHLKGWIFNIFYDCYSRQVSSVKLSPIVLPPSVPERLKLLLLLLLGKDVLNRGPATDSEILIIWFISWMICQWYFGEIVLADTFLVSFEFRYEKVLS